VELDGSVEYIAGATRDVTERKERERELREERQFIEQALDALDDPFYVLDTDSTLRRWNDQVPETTGYSDDDLTGMQAVELFPEDEREAVADNIATILAGGEATVEADLRTADGRRLPCEFTGAQLTDEEGSVIGLVGVGRDITERKEREQRLAETTRQLQAVLDTVDAAVVIKDVCEKYQYANKTARENLGVGVNEDITGLTDHDLLPADVAAQYRADDQRVIEAGDTIEIKERVPTPEGTQINRTLKSPFYDADGELTGVCAVSTDITERKKREQRLSRLKILMSEMEKLADMGAWEYDPETGEVTNTAGTKRIYGLEPDAELTLEEAFNFFHPADRDQLRNRFEACLETGEPYEIDIRIITADGEEKWVTAQGQQVNSQDDTSVLRVYIRDITAQKE
jgi:PAS domain S-box-containing protein